MEMRPGESQIFWQRDTASFGGSSAQANAAGRVPGAGKRMRRAIRGHLKSRSSLVAPGSGKYADAGYHDGAANLAVIRIVGIF